MQTKQPKVKQAKRPKVKQANQQKAEEGPTVTESSTEGLHTHVQMDLTPTKQEQETLLQRICKIAGLECKDVRAMLASPPCETFSTADASNISRDHFHRDHSNPDKPPRTMESCRNRQAVLKRERAIAHDLLVKQIVRSFVRDSSGGAKYDLMMENPLGSLRQRPYMRGVAIEEHLTRRTVNYCAFGEEYSKATDLWTSFEWDPIGTTGNGRCCNGKCGMGKRTRRGRFRHHKVIAGKSDRSVKGPHRLKQIWKIPPPLTQEVMIALGPANSPKQVIIDLFSGGQSWKDTVIAAGYHYVSVDILAAEK